MTAQRDSDPELSNWAGKSYLLEAIPFALYGVLPGSHVRADAWISKGEKEGEVEVTLDTGVTIRRWRKPGAGTQVEVREGGRAWIGDAAELRVAETVIGLGLEDFRTTGWLEQGAASAIVKGDPSTRTAMVTRWLGIEKLERALALARGKANVADAQAKENVARYHAQLERLKRVEDAKPELLAAAEEKLAEWDELLALANEEEASKRLAQERSRLDAEIAPLYASLFSEEGEDLLTYECQTALENAKRARDVAQARAQAARLKRANRASVASGTFNGRCPVAGIECPATSTINDLGLVAHEEAERASIEEEEAKEGLRGAEAVLRTAEARERDRAARTATLDALQKRREAMAGGKGGGPPSGLVLGAVAAERERVLAEVLGLRGKLREQGEALAALSALQGEARSYTARLATAREGVALLGRAPRVLAEGTLGHIAGAANRILAEAGVELSFAIAWERESPKDLAEACEACGAAFPKSARVKACESCEEPRGMKKIRRLDYEFSDRSGAAEDLVGIAMSLSAGAWLRGERGSSFGYVSLDEPTAQMDRAHRRAMSQHLPRMFRAARVEQALVVSHSPDAVASLPGQILVKRSGRWATVEVVVT